MEEFKKLLGGMEPSQAAKAIAQAAGDIFPVLGDEERREIITQMLGDPGGDKVIGLVHL
jgi:hypothetical protein